MPDLIDQYLPGFDVCERHQLIVRATPRATYDAVREADLAARRVVGALLLLRRCPAHC